MARKNETLRVLRLLRALRLASFLARDPVAEARAILVAYIAAKR